MCEEHGKLNKTLFLQKGLMQMCNRTKYKWKKTKKKKKDQKIPGLEKTHSFGSIVNQGNHVYLSISDLKIYIYSKECILKTY